MWCQPDFSGENNGKRKKVLPFPKKLLKHATMWLNLKSIACQSQSRHETTNTPTYTSLEEAQVTRGAGARSAVTRG